MGITGQSCSNATNKDCVIPRYEISNFTDNTGEISDRNFYLKSNQLVCVCCRQSFS